ncbi:MAG: HD domain-containing protein [Gammaproteobacteria bacterium]|jgi:HD-GYP domain-containing protein (c-di-GMP phosphodiesterase class II)|nr:HD domain-containing protein [Gammaproteobacteria bacterium]
MTPYHDTLENLNRHMPLKEKLVAAHESMRQQFPFIARVAVTLYDPQSKILKTYLHSDENQEQLENYQELIENSPSLKALLDKGIPRVINNLLTFSKGEDDQTRRIARQGYKASYTLPMFNEGDFFGFLFFNSTEKDVFTEATLRQMDIYGHMIALMVINELSTIKALSAAIKTTNQITHCRDPETGSHLDRMSRYSRLIASSIAKKYRLDDEYIEHVFMFSSLHDIGKIAIPDEVLLKPGGLSDEEIIIMRTHARRGREMIDDLVNNFGLHNIKHIDVLRNIAEYHHEAVNGSGYPDGRVQNDIPLEARIVAVADVFDALTSRRPYKQAWDNQKAIDALKELTGEKLDADCVNALINNLDEIEKIQQLFIENSYG